MPSFNLQAIVFVLKSDSICNDYLQGTDTLGESVPWLVSIWIEK